MHSASPLRLMALAASVTLTLAACGSGSSGGGTGGTSGSGGGSGSGGAGGTTSTAGVTPNGLFEIHYRTADSYAEISGFMYDGATADQVIWEKKTTDGSCSLYQPRTPFCDACATGQVCVDTNVCRTPPSKKDVGAVTITGLTGFNPLDLIAVTGSTETSYNCLENPSIPPCTVGATVGLSATGNGDYPAFSVQTQCIAPLVVTNSTIALQSGAAFTLNWTASTVAGARINLTFDLSHHGGSKGKIICETSDTGSLQVSSSLIDKLLALGVTGYPKAYVTRLITGTTAVGSGQAQFKIYSDLDFVVQIPDLVSCEKDTDCPTGQTCLNTSNMCGVSCTTNADCPTGQTCSTSSNSCK